MLGRLPIRTLGPGRDDGLLRLRDGLLVRRPDRDDVVPGPRPGGRARPVAIGVALGAIRTPPGRGRPRGRRRGSAEPDWPATRAGGRARRGPAARGSASTGRQFLAGLLFGLACTSRLTIVFAAPFFVLVGAAARGSGAAGRRRSERGSRSACSSSTTSSSTGHLFHPGYQYLYELEAGFYTPLDYHLDWGIEDPRYLPQNLGIMFLNTPGLAAERRPVGARRLGGPLCTEPGAVRGLFDPRLPARLPQDTGMSILLTSPAYLLALPALRGATAAAASSPAPPWPS